MREIFCADCGTLVMRVEGQIKPGTVYYCRNCADNGSEKVGGLPGFMQGLFAGKKGDKNENNRTDQENS